jgi:hypothetical protein
MMAMAMAMAMAMTCLNPVCRRLPNTEYLMPFTECELRDVAVGV